ncbi:PadR family transcriptional regulator [Bacillus clarus]|uniref:PadR family transcriptional regulator n=1 Tax=Bacillus clarus TaxID=2338372 RepID=A0A090YU13_9BACI|nr:hypothetical protein [Bacillus clarus]KFN02364.1 hypothetical protein DJ93_5339 [Bacillus clarus]RFT66353.1 PadR family transcriptional regulator [Bacillus clarus]
MIFQNEKISLHLGVVKYQLENANNTCDRNWLMVKVKLSEENSVFETIDPCLETFELQYIIKWFQSLPNPKYNELDFTEPNLAFEFMEEKEGTFHIVICLSHEIKSSWCKEDEYSFVISMTQDERENIIRSLEEQQRNFPKR